MLFAIGAAVVGGALNALSGAAEDREMEKRKQAAMAQLRQNIIDPNELDSMLNNVNRLFNNRLVNTLNSTALQSRGVANSNVVKGITAGQIEAGRLGALTDTQLKVQEGNRQTYSQMAGIESSTGGRHNAIGDFASGALAAAPVGMELSKMLSPNTIIPGTQPQAIPVTDNSMDSMSTNIFDKLRGQETSDMTYPDPWDGKPIRKRFGSQISNDDILNYSWSK